MEVILLKDVKSLGKKGEIVKVNDGYARNYILPQKVGIEANAKNLNDLKLTKKKEEKIAAQILEEAKELAATLKESSVVVKMKAGEGGKTFGSISTKEIAVAIKEQLKLDIDKKKMVLDVPIKSLGSYIIKIKLHPKVVAELTVKVTEK
jgi:large subunit ribosomal protein L9